MNRRDKQYMYAISEGINQPKQGIQLVAKHKIPPTKIVFKRSKKHLKQHVAVTTDSKVVERKQQQYSTLNRHISFKDKTLGEIHMMMGTGKIKEFPLCGDTLAVMKELGIE